MDNSGLGSVSGRAGMGRLQALVQEELKVNDMGRARLERGGVGVGMLDSRRRFSQR